MAGTSSPGTEGPTVAPPHLPSGWIAQWDGQSRKYYFVELATGRSQWEVPTKPALVGGGTPNNGVDHPYGIPGSEGKGRIITHPDGSQTIQHPDGRMEPILPPGMGGPADGQRGGPDGARGMDGPAGDRGLGSFAQSALSSLAGGKKQGGSSNPLGDLASSLLGGNKHSSGGGGGAGGKIVSQLASSIFSSGNDKPSQPNNYHGGQTQGQQHGGGHSGGLAGQVMGGVAQMFGGSSSGSGNNFGYSNPGHSGPYNGPEPPISYMPPSKPGSGPLSPTTQSQNSHAPSYGGGAPTQHQYGSQPQQQHQSQQHHQPQHHQSQQPPHYPPPPNQSYGQQSYGGNPRY
ncbi:hypothetical protein MCOR25_008041 [Pyricularia grisea]|uniref:WW domain-containing protein n=1 Tax=Pyricularia grisea TaxID=148305 RepID=A0A6P8B4F9_PYRGI|nr:hypothetical protein PgNI_05772 [Pyricularia grisea]KAI6355958.1 hypothetical protein MCOR25_008041 [Pyricularia grisea]TLD10216.1 hypothetical protein PgNI_05772 [Pyricularia grisea]